MDNVYVCEKRHNKKEILSNAINSIIKTGYTHTAMLIHKGSELYFAELDGMKNPDYQIHNLGNTTVSQWKSDNKEYDIFKVPYSFTGHYLINMILWWNEKHKWNYGYLKLASFIFLAPFMPLIRSNYKKNGKIYKPFLGNVAKKEMVCSVAVSKCITEAGGFDICPDLDDDVIYPGVLGQRIKNIGNV